MKLLKLALTTLGVANTIPAVSNGNITASLKGNMIVIEDDDDHRYTVDAKLIGVNEIGNETDITWRRALQARKLIIQNDDIDGHSWGQHGSIFVRE